MTSTPPPDAGAALPARPGRPRRFDEAEERRRIFDAAFEVMRRNGYEKVTIGDILAEADVSTRSFYRHFASKDDLLTALFRHDADLFAAVVERRVAAAAGPSEALAVWIDEILAFAHDRPRARRAAVLGTPAAVRALPPGELRRALDAVAALLADVLARGADVGAFHDVDPDVDARFVSSVAWDTANLMREAAGAAERDALRAGALSFVRRALGAGPDDATMQT